MLHARIFVTITFVNIIASFTVGSIVVLGWTNATTPFWPHPGTSISPSHPKFSEGRTFRYDGGYAIWLTVLELISVLHFFGFIEGGLVIFTSRTSFSPATFSSTLPPACKSTPCLSSSATLSSIYMYSPFIIKILLCPLANCFNASRRTVQRPAFQFWSMPAYWEH